MNSHSSQPDWFFPIEEAPVFTTLFRNGNARDVRVPNKKALIAADSGEIISFNTMTDIASRPPKSPRFRRDRPTLERRAGAWLRDFRIAVSRLGFSVASHFDSLSKTEAAGSSSTAERSFTNPGSNTMSR